jgi:hypothetical protein
MVKRLPLDGDHGKELQLFYHPASTFSPPFAPPAADGIDRSGPLISANPAKAL